MRTSREEWRRRVERWRNSGQTADRFAAELGINAGTLKFWKYVLNRDAKAGAPRVRSRSTGTALIRRPTPAARPALMEVRATLETREARFELELAGGRRLRIPSGFDRESLRVLLGLLEAS